MKRILLASIMTASLPLAWADNLPTTVNNQPHVSVKQSKNIEKQPQTLEEWEEHMLYKLTESDRMVMRFEQELEEMNKEAERKIQERKRLKKKVSTTNTHESTKQQENKADK